MSRSKTAPLWSIKYSSIQYAHRRIHYHTIRAWVSDFQPGIRRNPIEPAVDTSRASLQLAWRILWRQIIFPRATPPTHIPWFHYSLLLNNFGITSKSREEPRQKYFFAVNRPALATVWDISAVFRSIFVRFSKTMLSLGFQVATLCINIKLVASWVLAIVQDSHRYLCTVDILAP